ncbi:MAG: nicotinate-nucleotide--dimethylbenzimidazole phosphoribosyltransferase, partial [Lentisphaeraceae bacterium]|nr:nicotinate-nucleotide--dimethylbenzimidazole phosphoribosyltransferase [Lentisphaeraceae bacterium]
MESLDKALASIKALEGEWIQKAHEYLDTLAMPPGALGEVNVIAARLCGIQKTLKPKTDKKTIALCAADHGVVTKGVSKYPQITNAIVKTALSGGAAINSFCKQAGSDLKVIDCGLVNPPQDEELMDLSIADGTLDFSEGPAMREEQCMKALDNGIRYGEYLSRHYDLIGLGEMGIGNSSSASAIAAVFLEKSIEEVTGQGTGVSGEELQNKIAIIKKSIALNNPDKTNAIDVLSKVGGFEIATMTGLILGLSAASTPIVLDGFISSSAALAAFAFSPASMDYCFAGHMSAEPGHKNVL